MHNLSSSRFLAIVVILGTARNTQVRCAYAHQDPVVVVILGMARNTQVRHAYDHPDPLLLLSF